MKTITPHLWFDKEAKVAAEFYTSLLPDSKITHVSTIHNTPSGDADIVSFELCGTPFMAISAGPLFKFNPSISFHIKCKTVEEVDILWEKISKGGEVLMEIGEYPFSKRYGWCKDKYGLSWQIIFAGEQMGKQRITPVLMYTKGRAGKAEEAIHFYAKVFSARDGKSKINMAMHYGKGEGPNKEGALKYGSFTLNGLEMGAMDAFGGHDFVFNEAISLIIPCENQEEIDYFWEKLSADPESEQCGWCKDKYGLSWQVWPIALGKMMQEGTPEQVDRVTKAFLQMKKFDIAELNKAYKK